MQSAQLKGVGGWLAFLIIALCTLWPASLLGQLSTEFLTAEDANPALKASQVWLTYKSYNNWAVLFVAVLSLSAGYRLWKIHTPQSVRFAILILWISAPANALGFYLATRYSFGTAGLPGIGAEIGAAILRGSIAATVWTAYLLLSQRVKNTYYG